MPDQPQRPRQPSRPELTSILTPDQPERDAVHHPGLEGSAQPPPNRRGTLPGGMAAIPVASGEFARTLPAPNPLQKKTWRVPTPPSAVAAARRTDPPARAEPLTMSIRVPADEPAQSARQRDREAILEAELAKSRAAKAEAERQLRVQLESKGQGPYQTPIVTTPPTAPPVAHVTDSIHPDGTLASLRKAQTKAWLGIAALLAVLAVPLYTYVDALAKRTERLGVQTEQATTTAAAAKEKTGTNAKTQLTLEQQFRQHRANEREVWRLLGVDVPKADGDPEPENLEPMTPYCAPGKVCTGPQLVLRKSP